MKIEIDANDMLEVLVQAGIDDNSAKAIVLDLILTAEQQPQAPLPVAAPVAQPKATITTKPNPIRRPAPPQTEEEVETPTEGQATRTQVRKAPRLNFSFAGGPAEPLK